MSVIILVLTFIRIGRNSELEMEIAVLSERIDEITLAAADSERFNSEMEKIREKTELAFKKVPKEAQIPQAIDQLTWAIELMNMKLISIIPKEVVEAGKTEGGFSGEFGPPPEGELEAMPEDGYTQIPIEINLRGAYTDTGRCLNSLRVLERIVTVEEINIERSKDGGMLDIKLLVSVWYSKD